MYFKQPPHTYMPFYNKQTHETTTKIVPIISTIPTHHPKIVVFYRTFFLEAIKTAIKQSHLIRSPVSLTKTSSRLVNILSSAIIEAMKRVYFTSLIYEETFCNVFSFLLSYFNICCLFGFNLFLSIVNFI